MKPLPKEFLLSRGSCCKNGCKNCPYGYNKNKNMKVAICLIIKNENEYLEEWLNHHRNLGFDHFIIYDNQSAPSVTEYFLNKNLTHSDTTVIYWKDNAHASQLRAYKNCCKNYKEFDYVLFIDTDEFLYLKNHATIKEFINSKEKFDGLGIYWRMYGGNYTNNKIPEKEYTKYYTNKHIKSLINPKKVINFPDPHKAVLQNDSIYIDELGNKITSPLGNHTSDNIWIKHIWTRSLSEWNEKLKRGSGDKVVRKYTEEDFINYNNECILND
jgi:hypothetical protein